MLLPTLIVYRADKHCIINETAFDEFAALGWSKAPPAPAPVIPEPQEPAPPAPAGKAKKSKES